MSTLFKKVTATAAALSIVLSIVSPVVGVKAADASLEAANRLAALGVIVDSSANPSAYNLGSSITRREMLKVMMNLSSVEVSDTCEGKFSDLPKSDWGCKYAEAALKAGFIAANPKFRPNDLVTEAEALKMIMQARGLAKTEGVADWADAYRQAAVAAGILAADAKVSSTTSAKRSMVFVSADSAVTATTGDAAEGSDDEGIDGIFDGIFDDEDGEDMTEGDTSDEDTTSDETSTSATGDLEVTLSADTPAGTDLPKNADGVNVMTFDVTAGDSDVTINSFVFERTGFGDSAVEEVAVYSDNGRVTKADDFNDDDIATVNASPAFVVKAGATETFYVRVNTSASTGEFQVALNEVVSSAANVELSNIVSNTFEVQNVAATVIDITDEGVNATVKLGEEGAELAEFKLSNEGNTSTTADVSVTVSSVTLKETEQDVTLENLALVVDGKEVATVDSMNGKYVTFNLANPITIDEDENETFTVVADVLDGANKKVKFEIESLTDITATASKYNAVSYTVAGSSTATKLSFDSVDVDAGELTLYSVDATSDETRADKDNVELGQIKIVNVSGETLELDDIALNLELSNTSSASFDTLGEVLDNVELVYGNTIEELTAEDEGSFESDYSATSLDLSIPQGTTYLTIRADFNKDVPADTTVTMSFDADPSNDESYTNFNVVETSDDEQVTDITPSTLSFDSVKVVTSDVTVSNVPLADVNVVKGSTNVVALQFEVKASDTSAAVLDEVKATVYAAATSTGTTKATKDEVSEIALYKGSVSDANLLDKVSGSKLSSGVATFDGFETTIASNKTETFIITVTVTDTDTVATKKIRVEMDRADLSLEDDDNDPIELTTTVLSDKVITVSNGGTLTIKEDTSNTDNKYTKTILAGNSKAVFSADIEATNEKVDVETLKFTLDKNIKKAVSTVSLYLNGVLVDTAANSDISDAASSVVTFDDLTTFEVPTSSVEVQLVLNTATIGYEKVGEAVSNAKVTKVEIIDATGIDSNEDASVVANSTNDGQGTLTINSAKTFSIVPSVVTPSVYASLSSSTTPQIQIYADAGSNSEATSNTTPKTYIDEIAFSLLGTTDADVANITYTLVNIDDANNTTVGVVVGNTLTFDLASDLDDANRSIASGSSERFKIVITNAQTDKDTIELTLLKDGITYSVSSASSITTNLTDDVEFGSRTY